MTQDLENESLQFAVGFHFDDVTAPPVMQFQGGTAQVLFRLKEMMQCLSSLLTQFALTEEVLEEGKPGQELFLRFSPIRRRSSLSSSVRESIPERLTLVRSSSSRTSSSRSRSCGALGWG